MATAGKPLNVTKVDVAKHKFCGGQTQIWWDSRHIICIGNHTRARIYVVLGEDDFFLYRFSQPLCCVRGTLIIFYDYSCGQHNVVLPGIQGHLPPGIVGCAA